MAVEALVVFHGDWTTIADWAQGALRVLHRLPPRLAVVSADSESVLAGLRGLPSVAGVYPGVIPEDVLNLLSPQERLFVQGWEARKEPKQRRGEGANWDAAGFLPPDPPP